MPAVARLSQPVPLQAAIEGAAAQTESRGRLADVAAMTLEGLLDQEGLDLLEAQVLDGGAGGV